MKSKSAWSREEISRLTQAELDSLSDEELLLIVQSLNVSNSRVRADHRRFLPRSQLQRLAGLVRNEMRRHQHP